MGSLAETAAGEAQLYERHSQLVYRHCLRMLGSREDAEDAAQTTFFQALRALRRGVVPTFEQAWLLKIASNECKSRHRAGFRRSQREFTHDPQTLADVAEAAPNGGDGRLLGVRQALTRLPEMQRRALLLREWQGRSYAEIAHELGTTRPAVEALLFRARRGLARELGEETKERRHAFDLASLLGTLKSLLSGGAAVKLAAGVAAVATVGTVAVTTRDAPAPTVGRQKIVPVERAVSPIRVASTSVAEGRAGSRQRAASAVPVARQKPAARAEKPGSTAPAHQPPAPSPAEQSSPQAPPAQVPTTAPVQAPSVPAVPAVPVPQPPLPAPVVQVPEVPVLPPVPQVQVPQVPLLPQVPDVPVLPDAPDLPVVGDVPILP